MTVLPIALVILIDPSDSDKIIEMSGYANNGSIVCGLAIHNLLLASALIYNVGSGSSCCKPVLEIPFQKILRCANHPQSSGFLASNLVPPGPQPCIIFSSSTPARSAEIRSWPNWPADPGQIERHESYQCYYDTDAIKDYLMYVMQDPERI